MERERDREQDEDLGEDALEDEDACSLVQHETSCVSYAELGTNGTQSEGR